jgi:hypothetical protein
VAAVRVPVMHEDVPVTMKPLLHVGAQKVPDARAAVHVPTAPLVGAADALQLATQVAAVSMPVMHDDVPVTMKPLLHIGAHVVPDASAAVQVPIVPLLGAIDASQLAVQFAGVSLPDLHDDVPVTMKPLLHFGAQVVPDASTAVHVPTAPLLGAIDASQPAVQFAAVSLPDLHDDAPVTMKPLSHVGTHVLPDASAAVQEPAVPLVGAIEASHVAAAVLAKNAARAVVAVLLVDSGAGP